MKLDAYEISDKIKKYWCALYPKHSGELNKPDSKIKVVVKTNDGYQEVVGVHIHENMIELDLHKE